MILLKDMTVVAEKGKGTRQWWELEESQKLYELAIDNRAIIKSKSKTENASKKRDKVWTKITSK